MGKLKTYHRRNIGNATPSQILRTLFLFSHSHLFCSEWHFKMMFAHTLCPLLSGKAILRYCFICIRRGGVSPPAKRTNIRLHSTEKKKKHNRNRICAFDIIRLIFRKSVLPLCVTLWSWCRRQPMYYTLKKRFCKYPFYTIFCRKIRAKRYTIEKCGRGVNVFCWFLPWFYQNVVVVS